jgi:hypothetical protein
VATIPLPDPPNCPCHPELLFLMTDTFVPDEFQHIAEDMRAIKPYSPAAMEF